GLGVLLGGALVAAGCARPDSRAAPRAATAPVRPAVAGVTAAQPARELELAADPAAPPFNPPSWDDLEDLLDSSPGMYGVVVDAPGGRDGLRYHADRVFRSASVYKLLVTWAVLRQVERSALGLNQPVTITEDDAQEAEPADGLGPGDEVRLSD